MQHYLQILLFLMKKYVTNSGLKNILNGKPCDD